MSPINLLFGDPIQSILGIVKSGGAANITNSTTQAGNTHSPGSGTDTSQLSPFAQLMSTLQQLQQSSPSQYQQVTQQIATNLQAAAQTAQTQGNTASAGSLNQIATDFTQASASGQLPNALDLAKAIGHLHGHHAASTGGTSSSSAAGSTESFGSSSMSATGTAASSRSQNLSSLLAALQTNSAQGNPLNPATVIFNTLSGAGVVGGGQYFSQ